MKKLIKNFAVLFLIFFVFFTFSLSASAEKILVTSIGQNPGGLMIKVVLNKLNLDFTYQSLIKSEEIEGYSTIILSVGCSQKGLCAADSSFEEELQRTKRIVKKLKEENYQVILVHLGGKLKRDEKSNELLSEVVPISSHFVITEESNNDNYFSNYSQEKNIELHMIDNLSKLETVFKEIF